MPGSSPLFEPVAKAAAPPAPAALAPTAASTPIRRINASDSQKIEPLLELVSELSRCTEPGEVLQAYTRGIRKLRGPFGYISLSTRDLKPGEYRITRLLSPDEMAALTPDTAWPPPPNTPIRTGGLIGEIVSQSRPALIEELHLHDDPVVGDALARYRTLMAVPLFDGGDALNWAILMSEKPRAYGPMDVEEAMLRGNLVGGTVRAVIIAGELRKANERIRNEIEQIARIQQSLLPESLPEIAGLSLAAHYLMYDEAGGDYYDFLPFKHLHGRYGPGSGDPDAQWGILVADASGHGPAAAVVMAMVHAILHAYPSLPEGPAEVLDHLNAHLCAKRIHSTFVTAFFAIYDPQTRSFNYARAGHDPPILKNPGEGGSVSRLDHVGGLPLGIDRETRYEATSITLKPGQSVVIYTDGITDSTCPDGRRFGVIGMERALTQCTGMPECVVGSVTDALTAHQKQLKQIDDQTIVVMRVND